MSHYDKRFLYVAEGESRSKIGITSDLDKRMVTLPWEYGVSRYVQTWDLGFEASLVESVVCILLSNYCVGSHARECFTCSSDEVVKAAEKARALVKRNDLSILKRRHVPPYLVERHTMMRVVEQRRDGLGSRQWPMPEGFFLQNHDHVIAYYQELRT